MKTCKCIESKLLNIGIKSKTEVETSLLESVWEWIIIIIIKTNCFLWCFSWIHYNDPQQQTCVFRLQVEEPSEAETLHFPWRQNIVPAERQPAENLKKIHLHIHFWKKCKENVSIIDTQPNIIFLVSRTSSSPPVHPAPRCASGD